MKIILLYRKGWSSEMICFSGQMYRVCRYWQPGSPLLPRNKNRTVWGLRDLYQLGEIITLHLFKLKCKKLKPCQRRGACLPRLFSGRHPVVEATCRSGNRAALLLVPGWCVGREAPPGLPLWPSLQLSQQRCWFSCCLGAGINRRTVSIHLGSQVWKEGERWSLQRRDVSD